MIQDDADQIKSVWSEPARDIDKKDIQMIKSYANPPKTVGVVASAVMMIFHPEIDNKDNYKGFKSQIKDPNAFIDKCVNFDINKFDK